ncbi:MAG TPA: methyltransferase domain-containing protein [Candidatus Acidoferrales bacterium]|jgi:SAM-dependent methyltransferase|nr:methyltransferase domain-containing protein [Candidatus Acidoferrales bacterium]
MRSIRTDDAWELFNAGRYEEAIPLLCAAAEALDTAENWNDLGACEFKANHPQAEASFRRALSLDPLYHLAEVNLGVLLAAQKRYAEALPLLERARYVSNAEQRSAIEELLRSCRNAAGSVASKRPPIRDVEHPRILFVVGDFGANGFSEANASEAWMLCSALRFARPAWDVRFTSIEHVGEHEEIPRLHAKAGIELVSVSDSAESIRRESPDLLHIVSPWLKFIPESLLEDHPALMTLVGVDPTEHCTERDLENVRHLIDFGRLALVCECERAQEVLDQHGIKTRAMIPPVVPVPVVLPATATSREKLVCGFATSPYLEEHWEPRGIPLLLDLARVSPETRFLLAWRTSPERIEREIARRRLGNVCVRAGRLDMESFFADVDIVLLPFARAWGSHGSPLSGVEGLLRGKPLLVTEHVGIAEWVRREGAGVVAAATAAALRSGLLQMAAHYKSYSRQARMAAHRRFNSDANAAAYRPIYAEMLESVKGPTLAEWEADTRRAGRELVRGREALAIYYTQASVANRYIADRFAAPPFDQLNAQELEAVPKLIRAKFGGRTDLKLLDFASGTGRLVPTLVPFGAVTALDGSAAMLAASDGANAAVRCIQGDVFHTAMNERFHVLACGRFLRHFEYPDRKRIYRRFRELLRTDGLAIVDLPDPQFECDIRDRTGWGNFPIYDVFWTLPSFRDELRQNGFQLASFTPVGKNVQIYEGQPHLDEGCYYLVSFEPVDR